MKQEDNVICDLKVVRNENGLGIHIENIDAEFVREQLSMVLESVLEDLDDDYSENSSYNEDSRSPDVIPSESSDKVPFLYDFHTDEHGLHVDIACPDVPSMMDLLKVANIYPEDLGL